MSKYKESIKITGYEGILTYKEMQISGATGHGTSPRKGGQYRLIYKGIIMGVVTIKNVARMRTGAVMAFTEETGKGYPVSGANVEWQAI